MDSIIESNIGVNNESNVVLLEYSNQIHLFVHVCVLSTIKSS